MQCICMYDAQNFSFYVHDRGVLSRVIDFSRSIRSAGRAASDRVQTSHSYLLARAPARRLYCFFLSSFSTHCPLASLCLTVKQAIPVCSVLISHQRSSTLYPGTGAHICQMTSRAKRT